MMRNSNNTDVIYSNSKIQGKYSCYLYNDTINDIIISTVKENTPFLPQQLIIQPGIYKAGNNAIDMRKEGLYRIIFPEKNNYQIIVYNHNLRALLSALAWIHTHGDIDNKSSWTQLCDKATHDKIYLTCSHIADFTCKVLNAQGYKTRIVGGIASDMKNGLDDEHTLIEVFDKEANKWIVADIDNNSLFKSKNNETLLSFKEFRDALYTDNVKQVLISKDVKFDISGFKSLHNYTMGFIMERRNNSEQLLNWYRRIFKTMIIEKDFYSSSDPESIRNAHPNYTYYDSVALIKKYY
ncbi:MAG: hypothetical protein JST82_08450 [Bacteroidetes bacterium]|nr:hypothetical protein [Bacteroidota bacterium]